MLRLSSSIKLAILPSFAVLAFAFFTLGEFAPRDVFAQEHSSRRNQDAAKENQASRSKVTLAANQTRSSDRPNIILINLDDADVDIFSDEMLNRYLPNIKTLATQGMRFTNCHVTTPLCGPSRVCLLVGQHAHQTGIKTNLATGKLNNGFSGGVDLFRAKGYEQEHVGVWMDRAGYRTMMIGKYLHGRMDPTGIPGWDDLFMCFGGQYFGTAYYSTRLPVGSRRRPTGMDDYRTVVEGDEAIQMIEAQAKRNGEPGMEKRQPFFLYYAPLAPHLPTGKAEMLEKKYRDLGKKLRIPSTPDFNEADIDDKPTHLRAPKLTVEQVEKLQEEYRRRVMVTKSVDDLIGRLFDVLDQTGMRKNTYIFLTSDHGYQLGHNRMLAKKLPYHRNTIVPLYVVGPNVSHGTDDHLLAHIDLTATFLDIAGGSSPLPLAGKSILPLLKDPSKVKYDDFRKSLLIQCWEDKGRLGTTVHCRYASLRTRKEIYTHWSNGAREYYDLASDPYQLQNQYDELPAKQRIDFENRLRELKKGTDTPLVTISDHPLISRFAIFKGVAEDDKSIDEVQIEIENPRKRLFWDGSQWQPEKKSIPVALANPKGLITDWQYRVDLSAIGHGGQVVVRAVANDNQSHASKVVQKTFEVDAIEPKTVLIKPAQNVTVESPVMIRGECEDNYQMAGIEITLQRLNDNAYWDGFEWRQSETTFFKRVDTR